ncbi:MAG: type II toxin-antitoxin system PemK/MazF family toxin [Roseiflexaceae bacterium]
MKQYSAGEILLLSFPFTDATGAKRRPALILLDLGDDDIVVARVTSQLTQTNYDIELIDWQREGLLFPSVVRIHKLATLEKYLVERKLGKLTRRDWSRVRALIQQLWSAI